MSINQSTSNPPQYRHLALSLTAFALLSVGLAAQAHDGDGYRADRGYETTRHHRFDPDRNDHRRYDRRDDRDDYGYRDYQQHDRHNGYYAHQRPRYDDRHDRRYARDGWHRRSEQRRHGFFGRW